MTQSGVYRLTVGKAFLIGAAGNIDRAFADHVRKLEAGTHPVAGLQEAWSRGGEADVELVKDMPRKPESVESDAEYEHRLATWAAIEAKGCGETPATGGEDFGNRMRRKWQDPEFRAARVSAMRGRVASDATREKLAAAKTGGRNPNAKACFTSWQGERKEFPSAADAARAFGVPQQVMDLWLRGKVGWPSSGGKGRPTRYPQWVGLAGGYV